MLNRQITITGDTKGSEWHRRDHNDDDAVCDTCGAPAHWSRVRSDAVRLYFCAPSLALALIHHAPYCAREQ